MQDNHRSLHDAFARDPLDPSVCVADGYGIRIRVERGHLVVADGLGPQRRERRYARATHGLRRLVILGRAGYLTLEALRWCAHLGIGVVQLDPAGRVLATSGVRKLDNSHLRRAQALSAGTEVGISIARTLLDTKLEGQSRVVGALDSTAAHSICALREELADASTLDECRRIEAAAAATYWASWSQLPVSFARRDIPRVPAHWRVFGTRSSPLTDAPRRAANPANAVLNYCYALTEAECSLALATLGLDPGLGWLHADRVARDSAALDLLEAVRPIVDAYVLRLLAERSFGKRDFHEASDGTCHILPPLTHELAPTVSVWHSAAGPPAEHIAQFLMDSALLRPTTAGGNARRRFVPTLLTQARRSGAQAPVRRARQQSAAAPKLPPNACGGCGVRLRRGRWCEQCLGKRRAENAQELSRAGQVALTELRTAGRAPSGSPQARAQRSAVMRRRAADRKAWAQGEHRHEIDLGYYRTEILPALAHVSVRQLAKATGLSIGYCSGIRSGTKIPHQMHWATLAECV